MDPNQNPQDQPVNSSEPTVVSPSSETQTPPTQAVTPSPQEVQQPVAPQQQSQTFAGAPVPGAVGVAPPPQAVGEENRRLVAYLMFFAFGWYGGHFFYLGKKTLGWIRLVIGLTYFIPIVNFVTVIVGVIWWLIDFILFAQNKVTDSQGRKLTATDRENKISKLLTMIIGIIIIIVVTMIVLFFSMGLFSLFDKLNSSADLQNETINNSSQETILQQGQNYGPGATE